MAVYFYQILAHTTVQCWRAKCMNPHTRRAGPYCKLTMISSRHFYFFIFFLCNDDTSIQGQGRIKPPLGLLKNSVVCLIKYWFTALVLFAVSPFFFNLIINNIVDIYQLTPDYLHKIAQRLLVLKIVTSFLLQCTFHIATLNKP